MRNEPLTRERQQILDELMRYHSERLYQDQTTRALIREAKDLRHPVSLARAMRSMADGRGLHSPEKDFFSAAARGGLRLSQCHRSKPIRDGGC
jgi:hypothetical protein